MIATASPLVVGVVAVAVAVVSTGLGLICQLSQYRLFATWRSRGIFAVLLVLAGVLGAAATFLRSFSAIPLSAVAPLGLWRNGEDKDPDGWLAQVRQMALFGALALETELQMVRDREVDAAAVVLQDDMVRESFIEHLERDSRSVFLSERRATERAAALKAAAHDPAGLAGLAYEWRKYGLLRDLQGPAGRLERGGS
jgi:hypothetical protein